MNIWIARQPIFDRNLRLHAYELLFRREQDDKIFDGTEAAAATTQVIAHTFLGIGFAKVLSGRKAFINLDRSLLIGSLHSILPPKDIVIEVLENVEADPEVLDACRNLRANGYTIALDDFICSPGVEPLTDFAQIIKVDFQATTRAEQQRMLRVYKPRGIAMLAEKVETQEELAWALAAGYDYFQGYFFQRPVVVSGRQIPPMKTSCLGLLSEIQREELDFDRIGTLVAGDVGLSWQLLRYVNSALSCSREQIHSIRQALAIVGENHIRHWVVLATLPAMAKGKPDELVTVALVRAHFNEYLAKVANIRQRSNAFLTGLFSLIDVLIDMPLDEALSRAHVAAPISAALLGTAPANDPLRLIYLLTIAWESGHWDDAARLATLAGLPHAVMAEAYSESTLWAAKALQGIARRNHSRRHTRLPNAGLLHLRWKEAATEQIVDATLVNVSTGGLGILATSAVPANAAVWFDAPGLGILGSGSVRYCHASGEENFIGIERVRGGAGSNDPD